MQKIKNKNKKKSVINCTP